MNILLIEPDALLAGTTAQFLSRRGHKIDWQVEPQAAIDAADGLQLDAVIMDIFLACKNGLEFLYEFRSYGDWQNVPVIIYGSLPAPVLASCQDSLAQLSLAGFYYKPSSSLQQLAEAIDSLQLVRA